MTNERRRLTREAPRLLSALKAYVAACKAQGIHLGPITGEAEAVIADVERGEPKAAKPKGICPVCHTPHALNENGKIRFHLVPGRGIRQQCGGSQQLPESPLAADAVDPHVVK